MQCIFMNVIINYYIFQMPIDFIFLYHRQYFYRSWLWVAWRITYKKRELLTLREYLGSPRFLKVSCCSSFKFSVLCFFSFRSVSCAKLYLCLLILHSVLILRFYLKVCYLDNLAKNIIAQLRYNGNDNYKNDLIFNLGVKKIARHSKIILNLYKKIKSNETTTDKKYVEKNNENKRWEIQNS